MIRSKWKAGTTVLDRLARALVVPWLSVRPAAASESVYLRRVTHVGE